jgi:hypothetical protein
MMSVVRVESGLRWWIEGNVEDLTVKICGGN